MIWALVAAVALVSAVMALFLDGEAITLCGFILMVLWVLIPLAGRRLERLYQLGESRVPGH